MTRPESEYTPQPLPVDLPPSPFVVDLMKRPEFNSPQRVLDVGCFDGRHSFYAAEFGHDVVGLDPAYGNIAAAMQRKSALGQAACHFLVADGAYLPFAEPFDAVLCTEVLHLMTKPHAKLTLRNMRLAAKPGGINAVSGYVVAPGTANQQNTEKMFAPGELLTSYENMGWQILHYDEVFLPNTMIGNKEHVNSTVRLIARRTR